MKNLFKSFLLALVAITVFSCNKDKSPTSLPLVGILMDHCGGSIVTGANLELWQEEIDLGGVVNDVPEQMVEALVTDNEGKFHVTEYEADYSYSIRYNVPGLGTVKLALGYLADEKDLDLGNFYTEGTKTDVLLRWTNDTTWTAADTILFHFPLADPVQFPVQTLFSTSAEMSATAAQVPAYTKMFNNRDPQVHLKWQLPIEYTHKSPFNIIVFDKAGYVDECATSQANILVGEH